MPSAKVLHWYTDGSGYGGKYGAGLYDFGEDYRDNWLLGSLSTSDCHKRSSKTHDPVAAGVGDDGSLGKSGTEKQGHLGLGPWTHRNPGSRVTSDRNTRDPGKETRRARQPGRSCPGRRQKWQRD
ncbi:hypothetical protein PV326_007085 [Microctonus aethiopoides]|nr:hypothetical protein PV326_007085 [Microctonus aethiopoides]